jgi:hypothetical protein
MGPDSDEGLFVPDSRRSIRLLGHNLIPHDERADHGGVLDVLDVVLVQVRVPQGLRGLALEEAVVQSV